jgi:hypothetical protein
MFGEDSDEDSKSSEEEEEEGSKTQTPAADPKFTAAEQGALQSLSAFFEHKLLIVTMAQPPRPLMATNPNWVLHIRRILVAGCSDEYCNQLFKELLKHRLVHCSFKGIANELSDEALDNVICLLDTGCMSLVSHV